MRPQATGLGNDDLAANRHVESLVTHLSYPIRAEGPQRTEMRPSYRGTEGGLRRDSPLGHLYARMLCMRTTYRVIAPVPSPMAADAGQTIRHFLLAAIFSRCRFLSFAASIASSVFLKVPNMAGQKKMAAAMLVPCCFGRLNSVPPSMNWQEQSIAGHEDPDWLILAVGWEHLHSWDCRVTLGQAFPRDSRLTLPRSAPRCPTFT